MAVGMGTAQAAEREESAPAAVPGAAQSAATGAEPEFTDPRWLPVLRLHCLLTVDLPAPEFKVSDLVRLRSGSVIATGWLVSRDVPLRVNGTLIGWSEFDVVGQRLAVRITEIA